MARLEFPRKVRAAAILRAAGHCERCSAVLKTGEAEFDHILPCALGGEPTLANCMVLCRPCHRGEGGKTAQDIGRIRKADRQRDKASGAIRPAGKIKSKGFDRKEKRAKPSLPPRPLFGARGALWPTSTNPEVRDVSD